jgi:hypothetical protein
MGRKSSPKRYTTPTTPQEIHDFKVPVYHEAASGQRMILHHYYPRKHSSGRWHWVQSHESTELHPSAEDVKKQYPHALHEDEFFGDHVRKNPDKSQWWLTLEEVYLATDGKEGTPSQSLEQDYRPTDTIPEDYYAMTRRRALKYAKVPQSEQGILTPEQLQIAQRAAETDDLTGWGALGDHLAENGYPNAGAVMSKVSTALPDAIDLHYWDSTPNDFRQKEVLDQQRPVGTFVYTVARDGSNLYHHVRLHSPNGRHYSFQWYQRPTTQSTDKLSRRRALCLS